MHQINRFKRLRATYLLVAALVNLLGFLVWWQFGSEGFKPLGVAMVLLCVVVMFVLQAATFAGVGDPDGKVPGWAVAAFILVFALLDAFMGLVAGALLSNSLKFNTVRLPIMDIEIVGLVGGLLIGICAVGYSGGALRRYAFLRMLLLVHVAVVVGLFMLLTGAYLLGLPWLNDDSIWIDIMTTSLGLVLWWGSSAATYLIVYRAARRRDLIADRQIAEDAEFN